MSLREKLSLGRFFLTSTIMTALGAVSVIVLSAREGQLSTTLFGLLLTFTAVLACRGRIWALLLLLTAAIGGGIAALTGELTWWIALPGVFGIVTVAAVTPTLFRRDRPASVVLITTATLFGVCLGFWTETTPIESTLRGALSGDRLREELRFDPTHPSYLQGQREARRDVALNDLRLLTYGYPGTQTFIFGELLESELGVDFRPIAGCVVNDEITNRAAGYNAIMEAEIEHRFGVGVLERIQDASEEKYNEQCGPDTLCM